MKRKGFAIGNFRMDEGRRWDGGSKLNQTNAPKARERMAEGKKSLYEAVEDQRERMENQGSLTDQVVMDFMGGSNAAKNQARSYGEVMDNFKNGKGAKEPSGSLAEAARKRMIERDSQKQRGEGKNPDIGRDKAHRRAYPPESGTRKDAVEKFSSGSFANDRENAIAWANADSR